MSNNAARWFGVLVVCAATAYAPGQDVPLSQAASDELVFLLASNGTDGSSVLEHLDLASRPPRECEVLDPPLDLRSTWRGTLWTGGVVPYVYNANATASMQAAMCEAMDELHTVCNVTFVPRTTQANYLMIQNSTGNNSFVGMIGGAQTVNIYNWNYKYIMAHELMHALGELHEQSRPDRGAYVQINAANICQNCCSGNPCNGNFNISTTATTVGAYDFESIMHYGATAFSINGQPTIQCIAPYTAFQSVIGNRSYLSAADKAGLATRYGPPVDDAYEPNDTLATAASVAGSTINLILTDRDDYVRVHLTSGSRTISVVGWALAPSESARLYVYTLAGGLLGSAPLVAGPSPIPSSASVTVTVVAGDYIIRLGRGCGQGGAYTLTVPSYCPADVNQSGIVSVQDIFDFLGFYFASTLPQADFNGSGTIGVQDIFDFLVAYFAAC